MTAATQIWSPRGTNGEARWRWQCDSTALLFLAQAARGDGSKVSDQPSHSSPDPCLPWKLPPPEAPAAPARVRTAAMARVRAPMETEAAKEEREGRAALFPPFFFTFRVFNQPVCAHSSMPFICWVFESRQCLAIFMSLQPFKINHRIRTAVRVTPPKVDKGKGDHTTNLKTLPTQF